MTEIDLRVGDMYSDFFTGLTIQGIAVFAYDQR
jgi:hypothetical protein